MSNPLTAVTFSFIVRVLVKNGIVVLLIVLYPLTTNAQQNDGVKVRHQFTFSCDNNLFLLNGKDGYYTSGIFLKYYSASKKRFRIAQKRIMSYEVGQMIYNAYNRKILQYPNTMFPGGIEQIDRPITGYLFGKVSASSFYARNKMLTMGISIGAIGENSFGKQVQESWHKIIGIKAHWNWVWDYQLNSEVGINVHGAYAFSLLDQEKNPWIQVTPVTQVTLGTIFTNISQAIVFQFGKLQSMSFSGYWNSRLDKDAVTKHHDAELFLFFKPEITCQVYNATVQGGLFRDDKGPIVSDITPYLFSQDIGVRYSTTKYCLGYHITLQTREARSQFHHHAYANITAALRFR